MTAVACSLSLLSATAASAQQSKQTSTSATSGSANTFSKAPLTQRWPQPSISKPWKASQSANTWLPKSKVIWRSSASRCRFTLICSVHQHRRAGHRCGHRRAKSSCQPWWDHTLLPGHYAFRVQRRRIRLALPCWRLRQHARGWLYVCCVAEPPPPPKSFKGYRNGKTWSEGSFGMKRP